MTCVCNGAWKDGVLRIERRIIGIAIKTILGEGLSITVHDGEEFTIEKSRDANEIIKRVASTEITIFDVYQLDGYMTGYIVFIHGNDSDVLSDHSYGDRIEKLVAHIQAKVELS